MHKHIAHAIINEMISDILVRSAKRRDFSRRGGWLSDFFLHYEI